MAASVLNSDRAAEVSVFVVRAFVRMSRMLASHRQFALKLADLWRWESGAQRELELTTVNGWEHFEAAQKRGVGTLLVTPHLGNWELGGAVMVGRGVKLLVVTLEEPSPGLTELRRASRLQRGIETLVLGRDAFAVVEIIKRLQEGATVALLVDRPLPANATIVEFCGRPFAASLAAAELRDDEEEDGARDEDGRVERSAFPPRGRVVPDHHQEPVHPVEDPEDEEEEVERLPLRRREPRGDLLVRHHPVASVEHRVHFAVQRGRERELEVAEEVVSAPAALHPRPRGEVEPQVRVGDEEEPHRGNLACLPDGASGRSGRGSPAISRPWPRARGPRAARRSRPPSFDVQVEAGAGSNAGFSDADYQQSGAVVCAPGVYEVTPGDCLPSSSNGTPLDRRRKAR